MELEVQVKFAEIHSLFLRNTHTMETIGSLIETIRMNGRELSNKAKREILEIPMCVLKEQSELISQSRWARERSTYFSGNTQGDEFSEIFSSGEFSLDDIRRYLDYIISDDSRLDSDFKLRNIEVTLRDDVKPKQYSSFENSGLLFARVLEKAFDM